MPVSSSRLKLATIGLILCLPACATSDQSRLEIPPHLLGRVTSSNSQPVSVADGSKESAGKVELKSPAASRSVDSQVKAVQATSTDLLGVPVVLPPNLSTPEFYSTNIARQSIGLEQALTGALLGNPDLITLRENAPASAEAVEVARRFPAALNPTLWVNPRPGVWERNIKNNGYHTTQGYFNISIRQPIELGHQTTHRHNIAIAAYEQAQSMIHQAEMTLLVQTYRTFQTAAYRRDKLKLSEELIRFNEKLVTTLRRGVENNAVKADDLALAEVEHEAVLQQVELARQDYETALADLQNQIGHPQSAGVIEPLGDFVLPSFIEEAQDEALINLALTTRPEIVAARAASKGTQSAILLAKGDKIPTLLVGPEYTKDEFGNHFAGFIAAVPLPILNSGAPLVRQREAEHRRALTAVEQLEQRTTTQIKVATIKWNSANRLVNQIEKSTTNLKASVARLEKLFEANQTDISRLLQARQRLIQLENSRLDAIWQATQAQSDLMLAVGAPSVIGTLPAGS